MTFAEFKKTRQYRDLVTALRAASNVAGAFNLATFLAGTVYGILSQGFGEPADVELAKELAVTLAHGGGGLD